MTTFAIARLTFLEAVRRRIVLAALLLGLAFLILYATGFYFAQRDIAPIAADGPGLGMLYRSGLVSGFTIMGLYAVNFLAIAMAVLATADTLAGEIGSGTIQALVSKPLRRSAIVLGKWLGLAGLLGLYLLLMAGGAMLIAFLLAGYVVPNAFTGLGLIYLEVLLVMTVTLACSSTLSTLATGGVALGLFGLAFLGGWVEQFGALARSQTAVNLGIISSLIMPSEAIWHRASYEMTPALARTLGMATAGPFITTSVPSPLMVAYGLLFLLAMLGFAIHRFAQRDL
jgi:ABC-type transport system involved in multi-copper enzyme maturation permease subunit